MYTVLLPSSMPGVRHPFSLASCTVSHIYIYIVFEIKWFARVEPNITKPNILFFDRVNNFQVYPYNYPIHCSVG